MPFIMLFHGCAVIGQFFVGHLEDRAPLIVEAAVLNFLNTRIQTQRLFREMSPLRSTHVQGHEIRSNVRYADRRAHTAHHTIHEHFRDALEIAEYGFPHAFAHIDPLWAGFGAGIAVPAKRGFGIEIEEVLLRILQRLQVVRGLACWERRHHRDRHAVLHCHLAGKAGPYFRIVFGPVVGRTGAAEPTQTAGPANDFLARIPEGLNDRDPFRHFILLAGDLDCDHPRLEHLGLIDHIGVFLCHFFSKSVLSSQPLAFSLRIYSLIANC
jgi:hypothetical protein